MSLLMTCPECGQKPGGAALNEPCCPECEAPVKPIRALTIRPIWLHMIALSYRGFSPKRVENRTNRNGNAGQPCAHRGPLLLHASQRQARLEFDEVVADLLTPYSEPLRQSAKDGCSLAHYNAAMAQKRRGPLLLLSKAPALDDVACGGIVAYTTVLGHLRPDGTADLGPCAACGDEATRRKCCHLCGHRGRKTLSAAQVRQRFDLRWWRGGHALLFGDVTPLPFVACQGALNAWQVQADVLAELERLGWRFGADGKPIRRKGRRWLSTLGPCR